MAVPEVAIRWLPGLGGSPGAVDLMMVGPLGPVERAVCLSEALTVSVVIDLFCPGSNLCETVNELARRSADGQRRRGQW